MSGSNIADEIDREYKRRKFYDEFLEKMVEDFVEDMRNKKEEQNSIK